MMPDSDTPATTARVHISQVLQACNFDVDKAGEALLEGRHKSLLRQWGVIDKRGKGKVSLASSPKQHESFAMRWLS